MFSFENVKDTQGPFYKDRLSTKVFPQWEFLYCEDGIFILRWPPDYYVEMNHQLISNIVELFIVDYN